LEEDHTYDPEYMACEEANYGNMGALHQEKEAPLVHINIFASVIENKG